jgi:peroxiredoxin
MKFGAGLSGRGQDGALKMKALKSQLDEARRGFEAEAPKDLAEAIRASVTAINDSDLVESALKAGDYAPGFRLRDRQEKTFDLDDQLGRGPVVLSFYLGGWCPYCNMELQALQAALPEFEQLGASIIAVSPDPVASRNASRQAKTPFPLLIDPGARTARRYGIAFRLTEPLRSIYAAMGLPPATDGLLPVPATYVVSGNAQIVLSYIDPDFTTRLEPAEILVALKCLRDSKRSRARQPKKDC